MARMIHCDECDLAVEEDVAEAGWHTLRWNVGSGAFNETHFCSLECLNDWAVATIKENMEGTTDDDG